MAINFNSIGGLVRSAQQQRDLLKNQQLAAVISGQQAMMKAHQQTQMQQAQQLYNAGTAATSTSVGYITSTTGNTWTNANTVSGSIYGHANFSSPDHAVVREPTEDEKYVWAENLLRKKLFEERKMLVEWKRVAAMPRLWIAPNDNTPLFPTNVHVTEGFVLEADRTYVMPDGSTIRVDENGNYGIEDAEAKVIYRANKVREFNRFINASDQLEKFIADAHQLVDVDQAEVLKLPVEAFINWLVLQAAKADGDRTDHLPKVEDALKNTPAPRKSLPPPDEVHEEYDCAADCRVIKRVYVERIPHQIIEDRLLILPKIGVDYAI